MDRRRVEATSIWTAIHRMTWTPGCLVLRRVLDLPPWPLGSLNRLYDDLHTRYFGLLYLHLCRLAPVPPPLRRHSLSKSSDVSGLSFNGLFQCYYINIYTFRHINRKRICYLLIMVNWNLFDIYKFVNKHNTTCFSYGIKIL